MKRSARIGWVMVALWLLFALPVFAQVGNGGVTLDQVNQIAKKLYCPVCPNETLYDCQTQACAQWRDEIRVQLTQGATDQQIIDQFVSRYGDRVLGTPQNPTLRALSLVTPFALAGLALVIGLGTFLRWRGRPRPQSEAASDISPGSEAYRDQLEQDLRE